MRGQVKTSLGLGRSSYALPFSLEAIIGTPTDMKKARRASWEHAGVDHRRPPSSKGSPKPPPAANLDMTIESPPVVFYGPATTSTGALLSGQLVLAINEREVRMSSLTLVLLASVTTKKPVHVHCPDCATKVSNLFKMEFLKEPHTLKKGTHLFPFSYLLEGHLPATSYGTLGIIDYKLSAHAISSTDDAFHFERPLKVQRAIMPGNDKTSTRIFPPTNITAHVVLPPVIHPIGEFPVQLRMAGVLRRGKDMQTRWRLRKMSWRIDEHSKMVSPACGRHSHKLGGEGKGVLHHDTRTIGGEEIKGGWKTDFSGSDGQIEMEFQAAMRPNADPVCDVDSEAGMTVTHSLIVELVVAEEYCPNKNTKLVTPTGAARVLRMTFSLVVTARMGLGISWDEEQPPVYSDVPVSPPSYSQMVDCEGETLDYEEL